LASRLGVTGLATTLRRCFFFFVFFCSLGRLLPGHQASSIRTHQCLAGPHLGFANRPSAGRGAGGGGSSRFVPRSLTSGGFAASRLAGLVYAPIPPTTPRDWAGEGRRKVFSSASATPDSGRAHFSWPASGPENGSFLRAGRFTAILKRRRASSPPLETTIAFKRRASRQRLDGATATSSRLRSSVPVAV